MVDKFKEYKKALTSGQEGVQFKLGQICFQWNFLYVNVKVFCLSAYHNIIQIKEKHIWKDAIRCECSSPENEHLCTEAEK